MEIPDGPTTQQLDWAQRFDAYERLAGTREELQRLLGSARNSYQIQGRTPDWCGIDLLRGWAFLLAEEIACRGTGELWAEWNAVVARIPDYPDAETTQARSGLVRSEIALPTQFSDRPKMHRETDFLSAKQARLWEPHIAPINRFVDEIRAEIESEVAQDRRTSQVYVPYVDPDSGGAAAQVLLVLESPSRKAALKGDQGSGMLSADNNDETAKNIWEAYRATGMPRTHGLHWNAVPWFVGTDARNSGVTSAQVDRGQEYLLRLLDLATDVDVLVAFGKPAQAAVRGITRQLGARGIDVVESIHPSPQNYASPTRDAKSRVHSAFMQALSRTGS